MKKIQTQKEKKAEKLILLYVNDILKTHLRNTIKNINKYRMEIDRIKLEGQKNGLLYGTQLIDSILEEHLSDILVTF